MALEHRFCQFLGKSVLPNLLLCKEHIQVFERQTLYSPTAYACFDCE